MPSEVSHGFGPPIEGKPNDNLSPQQSLAKLNGCEKSRSILMSIQLPKAARLHGYGAQRPAQ